MYIHFEIWNINRDVTNSVHKGSFWMQLIMNKIHCYAIKIKYTWVFSVQKEKYTVVCRHHCLLHSSVPLFGTAEMLTKPLRPSYSASTAQSREALMGWSDVSWRCGLHCRSSHLLLHDWLSSFDHRSWAESMIGSLFVLLDPESVLSETNCSIPQA